MIRRERVVKRKVTNFLQSAVLITGMLGLLATMGWSLAGNDGLLWLLLLGSLFLFLGPKVSQWDGFFSSSAPDWCFAFTRPARFRLMRLPACSAS